MGEQVRGARPTRAQVDLGALRRNLERLRERAGDRRVIAVVKANAYGHGAVPVARALADAGADALAVATFDEARELRASGLGLPILLLQGLHDEREADGILAQRFVPLVPDLSALAPLEAAAARRGRPAPIHLKLDTGMGRLGLQPEELDAALERVAGCRWLALEGIASHLAEADDAGSAQTARQVALFRDLVARVRERGFQPAWVHLDNSAGIVRGPTPCSTAVRPGIALYGADPTLERSFPLDPVMTLLTRVTHARDVTAGTRVGYGGTWEASADTRLLLLPIGYADGLPRSASPGFRVGVAGQRRPLVGRVSMDSAAVDAGRGSAAGVGAEVLIFGRRPGLTIRVEELADAAGTIAYEVLTGIGARVPRTY